MPKTKLPPSNSHSSVTLYCDGASRGNPGPSSFGFVLLSGDTTVFEGAERIGEVTNNVAEYSGLVAGLAKALELGANEIVVRSDSELLVRQLNGQYKVKSPGLKPLFERAQELLKKFDRTKVQHVPREDNKKADKLANEALDHKR